MKLKKWLVLSLFLISASFAWAADELLKIGVNDFSGGQNSYDIPHIISPNQGVSVKNAILSRKGKISKRKGVTLFATDESDTTWSGIGRFTPSATNDYLVAASGGIILRSDITASWIEVNSASTASALSAAAENTEFVQCNNLLAILDGVDYPAWFDGTTFVKGEIGDASPPIAKHGVWFKNYLFLANGETKRDWVWFSYNLEPNKFDNTNDIFRVNTGDGQAIQGLKPFKENELIIYKERSVWVLNISGATPLVDWTLQPILENFGCIAPRSIVNVNNDQWFLSSEPIGIRSLARTAYDKIQTSLVSTPIQDIFDGTGVIVINKEQIDKAAAVIFDNKYLLSIPTDTSTINNLVVCCDLITNGWSIIEGWYVADWEIFDNKLYFIDSSDGRVLRAFYGNNDQASGPVVTNTDASGPTTRGIDFHWESKAFNFDNSELYKLPDSVEVICESSGDYDLGVFVNLDNGGWQSVGTMNLSGVSTNLPQELPFTLSSEKLARYTFPIDKFGEFKEIQIGFDQSASDTIVEIREYNLFGKKRLWRRE